MTEWPCKDIQGHERIRDTNLSLDGIAYIKYTIFQNTEPRNIGVTSQDHQSIASDIVLPQSSSGFHNQGSCTPRIWQCQGYEENNTNTWKFVNPFKVEQHIDTEKIFGN